MGAMENENRITIPDFSKDDFLISSKPFQWIIDQADGNEFIKGQLVAQMAEKAKKLKGISHREASVLLACEDKELIQKVFDLAIKIKEEFYGNRIVMFAPLYLANYCVNGCTYCPYHYKNKHIRRKKLTQEEIKKEVIALQDMGHKRLALETGEDPVNIPIEYVLELSLIHISEPTRP